jgi:hypothetical protein
MVEISNDENSIVIFGQFLSMLTEERVSQIISRDLLSCICKSIAKMTPNIGRTFCEIALKSLQARAISFEEQGKNFVVKL